MSATADLFFLLLRAKPSCSVAGSLVVSNVGSGRELLLELGFVGESVMLLDWRFVELFVRGGDIINEAVSSSSSVVDVLSAVGRVKLALVSSSSSCTSGSAASIFSFSINDLFFFSAARALDARLAAELDFLLVLDFFLPMLRDELD